MVEKGCTHGHPLHHFSRKIMIEALEEHGKNVKLCGRPIIANKRVADDAEGFAEK